jgi:23S rRNA (cytidine2498-2'-O)-methyltransferase
VVKFLITSSDEFQNAAKAELKRIVPGLEEGETLEPGLFLASSPHSKAEFARLIAESHPIYVRHVFPLEIEVDLQNNPKDLTDMAELVSQQAQKEGWQPGDQFSVQARLVEPGMFSYSPFAIKEAVASKLIAANGLQENIKAPAQVVSVVCAGNRAYLGLSTPQQNLSGWAGGMRHYAKRPEQISRAEFKLLEALEVFDLTFPEKGTALDLGAAPGGWSRILLEAGLKVIAVDPANLDPRLYVPGLEHYRGYAADFLKKAESEGQTFDLICNDMRMDALVAANLMVEFARLLSPSGFALTTLKLPHETKKLKPATVASRAINILEKGYSLVRAKQLFHNRQEITVLLKNA